MNALRQPPAGAFIDDPHLADLDIHLITEIASRFILHHGQRHVETGEPVAGGVYEDTMAMELRRMLINPTLGARQVVPLIAMWVDAFDLDFDDPLFLLERRRLEQRQALADQLQHITQSGQPQTVTLSVVDILSTLSLRELPEALPHLEQQLFQPSRPTLPPHTIDDFIRRLRALLAQGDRTLTLTLSPEQLADHDDSSLDSETLHPALLHQQARQWLEQHEQATAQAFFDAYRRLSPALQQAVSQVMEDQIQQAGHQARTAHLRAQLPPPAPDRGWRSLLKPFRMLGRWLMPWKRQDHTA